MQTMLEDGRVVAIGLKGRGPHQEIEDRFWVSAEFEALADDEIDDAGNLQTYPDANTAWIKYAYCNETMPYKDVRVDRYMLENLWPSLPHVEPAAAPAKPKRIALRTERDAQYLARIQDIVDINGRLPTFKEDDEWRKREGVTQDIMRRLRAAHLPEEYKKGGRPKKNSQKKLG